MSEDQKFGTERTYNVKGFDLQSEMAGYMSPQYETQAPVRQPAVAEQPVNPDDDVSIVIFGGLEEQTRKLFKRDPDKNHILNSGSLPEDDMS